MTASSLHNNQPMEHCAWVQTNVLSQEQDRLGVEIKEKQEIKIILSRIIQDKTLPIYFPQGNQCHPLRREDKPRQQVRTRYVD